MTFQINVLDEVCSQSVASTVAAHPSKAELETASCAIQTSNQSSFYLNSLARGILCGMPFAADPSGLTLLSEMIVI